MMSLCVCGGFAVGSQINYGSGHFIRFKEGLSSASSLLLDHITPVNSLIVSDWCLSQQSRGERRGTPRSPVRSSGDHQEIYMMTSLVEYVTFVHVYTLYTTPEKSMFGSTS